MGEGGIFFLLSYLVLMHNLVLKNIYRKFLSNIHEENLALVNLLPVGV